ncbi:O-antigen ligase family protein [Ornithinimicrobium sediminis]|uniref:O-antigen ligase family protein n=1 Tax=Ornithinimicrobium sediminis TaxID=2904603 RepID=UPI001E33B166|nr:O-antigen ligase family protein [Ornithinimicrobium sediminis]MCE0486886.1 O-antigen ligase family protein [Ornithinimicrobium sediminis]
MTPRLDPGTAASPWGLRALGVLAVVVSVGIVVVVGYLAASQPALALGVAGVVLLAGISVRQPVVLPLVAMPLMVVVARVGPPGLDMSVSDLVLGVAFWPAVLLAPRPFSPDLRRLLWLNVVYQAATLLTVVANPFLANTVEWFHAWLLVSGSLVVGWAVGRSGYAVQGVSLFLLACVLLAASTVVQGALQWAGGSFAAIYPSWPWSMHKNFIGTLLSFSAVLAFVRPGWLRWPRWAMRLVFWVSAAGIAFAQSRQAMLALAVVLVIVSLRTHPDKGRQWFAALAMAPVALVVASLVRQDVESGNVHNSVFQRLTWFEDSVAAWQTNPWFGLGLRYWTTGETPYAFQPPQVFLEVLATTGVIGLLGFLVMAVGMLRVLWSMDPRYGTLAFAMLLTRLTQGQFDLFWVGVSVSVPFAVAGVCLGAHALHTADDRDEVGRRSSGRRLKESAS